LETAGSRKLVTGSFKETDARGGALRFAATASTANAITPEALAVETSTISSCRSGV
jgi:hypothetical protein